MESQSVLFCIQHQEDCCSLLVTGAGCEAAAVVFGSSQRQLWFHFLRQVLGGFLFLLANKGCFLSSFAGYFGLHMPLAWGFHLWRTGERERYERVTGKNAGEETRAWVCPCKTALQVYSPEHAPQIQLVNVTQLTRLWYKLITDIQFALRVYK